jgi:tripartite-type tricarboxylate transporter receptor subunit TctC
LVVSRVMQGTNMKFPRRNFLCLAAGIAALPAMPRMAAAQGYPPHPMTLIVPYPAGGGADAVARVIAEGMRAFLGQPIIIENVGGAGGSTGTGRVARAAPDGYTLGMGNWSTHVVNAAVSALPYDVVNDFQPVSLLIRFPLVLVARKELPANNLADLIAWLKAKSRSAAGSYPYATAITLPPLAARHCETRGLRVCRCNGGRCLL